jgi:hypothetical protein
MADTMARLSIPQEASSASSNTPTLIDERSQTRSSSNYTTSRTHEKLRQAELERDELRCAVEQERGIAARLKREGGLSSLSATDANLRILELKRDMRKAGVEAPRRADNNLFKSVVSTDLLFLIDTTGSMWGHINAAKEQVKSIVNDIKVAFFNEADVRMACVGYKDHGDVNQIQFLDFTHSADEVFSFLNELAATGGDDAPEDVLGGIRQALNATWQQQTRCIIHIADAPPHGKTLHDFSNSGSFATDRWVEPGSEPHNLTHEPLLKQMIGLHINYALLRINGTTDRMALVFSQAYTEASADVRLLRSNKYHGQANTLRRGSKNSAKAGLRFEEAELGTAFSHLKHLVVKMVTTSASRTAVRMSAETMKTEKKMDTFLGAIGEEDEEEPEEPPMESITPQWETPGWLDETLMVEGFSPDVVVHGASTLNEMMDHDDNIMMSITELTIHKRSRPFAQGAMRVASYARTNASTNRFVVKSFKRGGKRLAHLAEDMRCQALCKAFTLEFNALAGETSSIDFIVTTCLKGRSSKATDDEFLSLEPFIEGNYVKYNNNRGYINEDDDDHFNAAAQAFSHFTYERSHGRFLVSDLQGVGHVLTDPAIHTRDPERFPLTDTNLGNDGFKFFFATHTCNAICAKLGLQSDTSVLMSPDFQFKDSWPTIDDTVCCSNKLCGKVIRVASAMRSAKFKGYYWCENCFPQLTAFAAKRICVQEGPPHHEFDVSTFFYESQGRSTARKCQEHRENGGIESRKAVLDFPELARPRRGADMRAESGSLGRSHREGSALNLWSRLKGATKKKSSMFTRSRSGEEEK